MVQQSHLPMYIRTYIGSTGSQRIESKVSERYVQTHVHSTIIHNSQEMKATHCPLTDKRAKEMWYIHTMEYYSDLKRKDLLLHTTACKNLHTLY